MAIKARLMTEYGEERDCYLRLNNVEVSNHGQKATALFRGFLSREAYEQGRRYIAEHGVTFEADVTKPLWPQAYAALRTSVPNEIVDIGAVGKDEPEEASKHRARLQDDNARFAKAMAAAVDC